MPDLDPAPILDALASDPRLRVFLRGDRIETIPANRDVDLVSRRVRNYEFNPVWGFLPDQAWLR